MPHFISEGGQGFTDPAFHKLKVQKQVYKTLWGRGMEFGWDMKKLRPEPLPGNVGNEGDPHYLPKGTFISISLNERLRIVPAPEMAEITADIKKAVRDAAKEALLPEKTDRDRQLFEDMRKFDTQERCRYILTGSCDAILVEITEAAWLRDEEAMAVAEALKRMRAEAEARSVMAKGGAPKEEGDENDPPGARVRKKAAAAARG